MKVVLPDFTLTLTIDENGDTIMEHQFKEPDACPVFQAQIIMAVRNAMYDLLQSKGLDVVERISRALDDESK